MICIRCFLCIRISNRSIYFLFYRHARHGHGLAPNLTLPIEDKDGGCPSSSDVMKGGKRVFKWVWATFPTTAPVHHLSPHFSSAASYSIPPNSHNVYSSAMCVPLAQALVPSSPSLSLHMCRYYDPTHWCKWHQKCSQLVQTSPRSCSLLLARLTHRNIGPPGKPSHLFSLLSVMFHKDSPCRTKISLPALTELSFFPAWPWWRISPGSCSTRDC